MVVVLLAAGVITTAVLTSRGAGGDPTSPVASARPFTLPPVLSGAPVTLAAAPGRPTVLTFFASWCAPCTQELPRFEHLAASAGAPAVVGVDELDQRPAGPDLVRRTGVTFPAGYDHDGSIGRAWAVDGLPITVFIAPDGRVVDYHRGELGTSRLDALVHRLLGTAAAGAG